MTWNSRLGDAARPGKTALGLASLHHCEWSLSPVLVVEIGRGLDSATFTGGSTPLDPSHAAGR